MRAVFCAENGAEDHNISMMLWSATLYARMKKIVRTYVLIFARLDCSCHGQSVCHGRLI